ncbi:enoyl-CoA hydratase/carnithine racemase [Mycobacteroides abscessus subsp. abscessus]|nr:enoyl-CoA hydratase/carnithine racemase [Mycobacteroides abscessus subsp. abscessus]
MYKSILYNVQNGIATITLNRPEVLNAFNDEMLEELLDAYDRIDEDDAVRIVVVTGSGRAFCAGSDLSQGGDTFATDADDYRDTGGQLSLRVFRLKKPIIAAINGAAVGVGLTMTLPMDIRVVSKGVKLGFVFTRRGIGPEACSGWFLPKLVGIGKALEWVLTGRMLKTEEAVANGLVQIEADDALEVAYQLAEEIIQNTSAVSTSFSRELLWNMLGETGPLESHLAESRFLQWAGCRDDAKEGVQSFIEKRKPEFKMAISSLPSFIDKTKKEV